VQALDILTRHLPVRLNLCDVGIPPGTQAQAETLAVAEGSCVGAAGAEDEVEVRQFAP
jgi:hypothetical protein